MLRASVSVGGLAGLVQALPDTLPAQDARSAAFEFDDGLRLIVSTGTIERIDWIAIADRSRRSWAETISRGACDGWRVALLGEGRVGVDLESCDRIAINATPDDAWLTTGERTLIRTAAEPVRELACHWVLKEAYAKAVGLGLALSFDLFAFHGAHDAIVMTDFGGSPVEGWRFALYGHGEMLIGTAFQRRAI